MSSGTLTKGMRLCTMAYPFASTWLNTLLTDVIFSIYMGIDAAEALQITASPILSPDLLS